MKGEKVRRGVGTKGRGSDVTTGAVVHVHLSLVSGWS